MEINICSFDNMSFFGVLIKRRRLLNIFFFRVYFRKLMLFFILNFDELF